ncbi:hypothetical protein Rsub_05182 [Raphidocelis subcapitata]|uniref:Plastid lipid-associated protein/fibrillin conserved domain-containing protein n=1 Tax=Raphidocelis subcapitata TaxID=307507 RepID=A0A2V0NY54_9CHLO|nr:hypothetical protein Rsub_05182 [Raphidocelis subcapitata]|eukprot:GBF92568.1 hypothetical protein Rsub_05182 [Raphidocelis subcapitata]
MRASLSNCPGSSSTRVVVARRGHGAACRALAKGTTAVAAPRSSLPQAELAVLDVLRGARGRGKEGLSDAAVQQLNLAVSALEANGGAEAPTTLPAINGKWRLLYTSRPGSASPIQRTFTGVEAFSIYQQIDLASEQPRVNNIVDFGERIGYLIVQAEASTDARPLAGFTPREREGLPFGIMGKSFTYKPARPNTRIDFQFDQAAFHFKFLPFSIPYPVPFRILGDERKGWIDTTYMNAEGTFRLCRGNKGTLFILVKPPREGTPLEAQLLEAAAARDDARVLSLIGILQTENPTRAPARATERVSGTWRLVWSQQAENASPLQKWGSAQAKSYQVIDAEAGTLENVVDLGAATLRAQATCAPLSDDRTDVLISSAYTAIGGLKVPLPVKGTGYVDWLYLSDSLRVTRGSKGSLFVHLKEEGEA